MRAGLRQGRDEHLEAVCRAGGEAGCTETPPPARGLAPWRAHTAQPVICLGPPSAPLAPACRLINPPAQVVGGLLATGDPALGLPSYWVCLAKNKTTKKTQICLFCVL